MDSELIAELIALRKTLHRNAEPSGAENETGQIIVDFLSRFAPSKIVTGLGDSGLAAVYRFKAPGPTLLFRAELDALPIREDNDFSYRSRTANVSHKCGHDGHMAIVSGLAALLHADPARKGRVVLLFQPAEETGQGAAQVIESDGFKSLNPDYVFALHNLPGIQTGTVAVKSGVIACASIGLQLVLQGKTAHASQPEDGISPTAAMCDIIQSLTKMPHRLGVDDSHEIVTVVFARLGEKTFGTAPGYAEIMATLRSRQNDRLNAMMKEAGRIAADFSRKYNLNSETAWHDHFMACQNHPDAVAMVLQAAQACSQQVVHLTEPFRWSEDFGRFTDRYPGVLFALGAGKGTLPLHNSGYDFPDTLLPIGLSLFWQIIKQTLGQ
jgi:amidohydrolase